MLPRRFFKHRSIRRQLVVGVALVHAVLMTIFVGDLFLQQRQYLQQRHLQSATGLVQGIARHATGDLMSGDLVALQEIINGFIDYPDMRYAAILDTDGKVLAHTQVEHVGQMMSDPITQAMLKGPHVGRALVDDQDALDVATPIVWEGHLLGWVRFAAGWEGISGQLRQVAREGLLYGIGAIAVGVLLAMVMARRTTHRLYHLLQVAEATKAGRRDLRGEADSVNEVGRLAASFNAMLDVLSEREKALQQANHELEDRVEQRTAALAESEATQRAILEQANDAFVSTDVDGRVVTWNRMAETIFGWRRDEALGRRLVELIVPVEARTTHEGRLAHYLAGGDGTAPNRRTELRACRRDGSEFPIELSMRTRLTTTGETFFDGFVRDITERKALQQQLEEQAQQDSLTGLPNRRALMKMLPSAMARAQRSQQAMAVLFLDLDGFKGINDSHGHDAGDKVLRDFADRLKTQMRSVDTVARLAGDEFVVIAEGLSHPNDATTVAEKILQAATTPFDLADGVRACLSSSIGIRSWAPGETSDASELLTQADDAMYQAKHRGKGRFVHWRPAVLAGWQVPGGAASSATVSASREATHALPELALQ
jgi:diguanylate cyclase (GGDEF)-like protein/PAS domain S-box-containing protein